MSAPACRTRNLSVAYRADPVLRVDMVSTGEVGCLGDTAEEALTIAGVTGGVRGRIGGAVEGWEDVADWWTAGPDHDPEVVVADDDPLRLMYTSGTESRPKGVMLSSRSLIASTSAASSTAA